MWNDFSITHILITNLFLWNINLYLNCSLSVHMSLQWFWSPFGSIPWPMVSLFQFQNCLHIIKLWAVSGHCIAMSLQYSKSRKQQAPQLALGMRYMYCSWLFCAILCAFVHLFVLHCALLYQFCAFMCIIVYSKIRSMDQI